jgi:predicted DNA-binding transcriptional regulator AlpA
VTRRNKARYSYPPDYVSAETLAYRLDIAPSLIEVYVRDGVLPPPERLGSLKRWDFAEVVAFIKARSVIDDDALEINGRKRDAYLERLKRGTSA